MTWNSSSNNREWEGDNGDGIETMFKLFKAAMHVTRKLNKIQEKKDINAANIFIALILHLLQFEWFGGEHLETHETFYESKYIYFFPFPSIDQMLQYILSMIDSLHHKPYTFVVVFHGLYFPIFNLCISSMHKVWCLFHLRRLYMHYYVCSVHISTPFTAVSVCMQKYTYMENEKHIAYELIATEFFTLVLLALHFLHLYFLLFVCLLLFVYIYCNLLFRDEMTTVQR